MNPNTSPRTVRPLLTAALWMVVVIASIWVICIGRSILVPLVMAMLGVFLVEALSKFCQAIPGVGAKLPAWASKLLAHIIIIALAIGILWVVAENAADIGERAPVYQERLQSLYSSAVAEFGMDELEVFSKLKDSLKIGPIIGSIAGGLTGLMGNGFLVILFFFIMTLERQFLNAKLERFFDTKDQVNSFHRIWTQIERDIRIYLGVKTFVSPLVVILSLTFWGALWGIPGMLLCVPFTVITMIVFAQFPSTRRVAVLLSRNGEIKSPD